MNKKRRILTLAAVCTAIVLALTFCNRCSKNQSQGEAVTAADSIETMVEPVDVEPIATDEPTVAEPVVAEKSTTKAKKKKKPIQGEWFIENDVTKVKDIAFEEIADDIVVKPILTDEPIGNIYRMDGNSNDFIAADGNQATFYHIKDGKLVEKLHALGRGPGEYSVQILQTVYLPDEGLFYGCDINAGNIKCYQTSPFKFKTNFNISFLSQNNELEAMIALGRDHFLFTWEQGREFKVCDSCTIYEYDADANKIFNKGKFWNYGNYRMFTRSGNDVLISMREEKTVLYRYVDGKKQKVATIDYGDMEMTKEKVEVKKTGVNSLWQPVYAISPKDNATGCHYVQLTDSVMAYWLNPTINDLCHSYLTIATRDKVQNYRIHIGGLNYDVYPWMVDNGVYTMLVQGDWEEKINPDEKLSPVGKRIIEAMKGNDYDPVIVQFRLKNKYLKQ